MLIRFINVSTCANYSSRLAFQYGGKAKAAEAGRTNNDQGGKSTERLTETEKAEQAVSRLQEKQKTFQTKQKELAELEKKDPKLVLRVIGMISDIDLIDLVLLLGTNEQRAILAANPYLSAKQCEECFVLFALWSVTEPAYFTAFRNLAGNPNTSPKILERIYNVYRYSVELDFNGYRKDDPVILTNLKKNPSTPKLIKDKIFIPEEE